MREKALRKDGFDRPKNKLDTFPAIMYHDFAQPKILYGFFSRLRPGIIHMRKMMD